MNVLLFKKQLNYLKQFVSENFFTKISTKAQNGYLILK
jgi:hypothetical protein